MENKITIEGIKSGNKDSFDKLYEEYHLQLYRTAFLILGNKEDSEDVLQETFVSVFMNIRTLKDESKLIPWMFSILRNKAYSKYKKRQREFPDEDIYFRVDQNIQSYLEEDFALIFDMRNYLMKLKPKEREVLVLYYYNDFTIEEIANICKTFKGTVKSRLHRARKQMKEELNATSDYPKNPFLEEGVYE